MQHFADASGTCCSGRTKTGARLASRQLHMKYVNRKRRHRHSHRHQSGSELAVEESTIMPQWEGSGGLDDTESEDRSFRSPVGGWLSIGLGAASLLGSASGARMIGARPTRANRLAFAALGVSSVAYGLSILRRGSRQRRQLNGGEPAAQHTQGNVSVNATTTIRRSREEVYSFWRDFSNIPRFMRHIAHVTETNGHTTWEAQASFGPSVSWDAQIIADRPGEEILWRSTEQSLLSNHGAVYFRNAPGGRGTEIHVHIGFEPPLGAVGEGLAKLFRALPREQLNADLRRLKQLLELGEIVQSDASIHRGTHPAQPSASATGEER